MADSQVYLQRIEDSRYVDDNSNPNREECFLCRRMIQQSADFDRWFIEDESGWVPTHYSDFTDAFETEAGWVCSMDCLLDNPGEAL